MPRRVFITVAEVSGDQHAAHLIKSLRELEPDIVIEGIGGPLMQQAGAKIHFETVGKASMLLQAATRVFEMLNILKWTKKHFETNKPDLQICIDSPAMNFHFAKAAHERGIPVLYYVAPQLWAWREGRMKKLRKWVDQVACILPFEQEYFRSHGVNCTFVGHPLFDELPADHGQNNSDPWPGKTQRPPVVGLLPGSRKGEALANFPHLLEVGDRIRDAFNGVKFLVPTTPATSPVVKQMTMNRNDIEWAQDKFDEMVPRCDLCVTVSGTATLHVAGHGVPMIVVYRTQAWKWHLVARWLVKTRTYSLVNLLNTNREKIVPEYIPWYGSNEPVAQAAIEFLQKPQLLNAQREKIRNLIQSLDKPGASMNVAKMAMQMITEEKSAKTL